MKWLALLVGLAALGVMVWVGRVEAQSTLGVPMIGTITVTTNTLTVPWTAPSDNGGAAITAYDLQYIRTDADEGVAANWTVVEAWTSGGGTLEYALTDLPDGVQFDVQVRAENAGGDISDWSATVTGTTTDHGGTSSSATALTPGGSAIGRIEPTTDEDVFSIVLGADAELWIYTTGTLDTVGELLDASNTVLKEADSGTLLDSPSGFEFREELEAGTYYVRVSSFEERKAGSYRIHVQTFTDPGDTFETATEVTLDSATPGRIGPIGGSSGDADYFKLVLTAATDIWVMAFGTNETEDEPLDTEGRLYDSDKSPLYWDDDSELVGNEEGFMFWQRLDAGTYYIRVNGYHRRDVGPYTLHVRTAAEPGSTAATATALTLRVPETGRITSRTDRDFFRLTIEADTYVFIYALSFEGALPLTPTILDDQGAEVSMDVIPHANWAEQGFGPFSFSAWGKLEAGAYHIRIAPSGNATGSYLLDPLVSTYNRILEQCTGITTPQSDPWYGCQWHLSNTGQFEGGAGEDINVESVWEGGNLGSGVNVAVVDNGLQSDHPDLSANVVATRNHRYRGSGSVRDPFDTHGTAVAGLIAAAANDIGVRGVAPGASIYSYNLTADGVTTLDHQADAMTRNLMDTGVSNNSWGFQDNAVPHRPTALWEAAVARGVTQGYGGKGVVYVLAGGNGAGDNDDSNLDGRANFYAVTAVCAVGYGDTRSAYSEPGANLWVCAPSDSTAGLPEITTTFPMSRYTDGFSGTSAAAPIVSGVVALVRAANANLSWRDVKLILAASARQNDPTDRGWSDGALEYGSTTERYSFNHQYGFGVVDAQAAVTLAAGWPDHLPALRVLEVESGRLDIAIPDREVGATARPIVMTLDLDSHVDFIEFVEIELDVEHGSFRDLNIQLLSPAGESSTLSPSAAVVPITFISVFGFDGSHRFGSAKHLGEDAQGTWQLRLTDRHPEDTGTLRSWRIKVYGHGYVPGYAEIDEVTSGPGSLAVTWTAPTDTGREGSAVTSYDLRYIRDDATDFAAANWTEVTGTGSLDSLAHTVSRLDGEAKYRVQVRAVNADGNGPWSDVAVQRTQRALPDAPRSVVTTPRTEALAVSWRLPAYVGAGDPTAYDLRYIRSDALNKVDNLWDSVPNAWTTAGGELRYVIPSLDNGVQYDVQLLARNSAGESGWSAVAKGTPANINGPADFPSTETGRRSVPENTAAGVDIGEPVAARDDEGDTRTYSLTGGAANFDIDSATGQLQTKIALNHERTSSLSVTVAVHDGKASDGTASTAIDDTIGVTIEIEDVDEPPAVTGIPALTIRENSTAVASYSAIDPERVTSAFTWTLGGDDASAFAISGRGVLTFDPAPNFEAPTDSPPVNMYQVTVRATDESAVDDNARTGEFAVQVTVSDFDEPPEIEGTDTYTIEENSPKRVGGYTATDPEGAATTWLSLTGTDARHFTIDEFGELSFVDTPDYDRETNGNHDETYDVILRAGDGRKTARFPVTVTLTDVDEGPLIEGNAQVTVNEVIAPRPNQVVRVGAYTKRDPEGAATNWGPVGSSEVLSGDSAAFAFDQQTGRLTFASPPDYENGGGQYQVTLTANDGAEEGTLDVTVTVANLEETGTLTFVGEVTQGANGVLLQATLTDPDVVATETWVWQRRTGTSGPWMDIANTNASYTPSAADVGQYLRARVTYTDGAGTNDTTLTTATESRTVNDASGNQPPTPPDPLPQVDAIEENDGGRNVARVVFTDPEGERLTYSLDGSSEFAINPGTGQITVQSGGLDYENAPIHEVTVKAADPLGASATATLTVDVKDVNEPPTAVDLPVTVLRRRDGRHRCDQGGIRPGCRRHPDRGGCREQPKAREHDGERRDQRHHLHASSELPRLGQFHLPRSKTPGRPALEHCHGHHHRRRRERRPGVQLDRVRCPAPCRRARRRATTWGARWRPRTWRAPRSRTASSA